MSNTKLENLLDDIRFTNEATYAIVQEVRKMVRSASPKISERVMYGGVMFTDTKDFSCVFAYSKHVSLEFGRGCDMTDPHHVLEGGGKFRRHIKLHVLQDIQAKHLREYIIQALSINSQLAHAAR